MATRDRRGAEGIDNVAVVLRLLYWLLHAQQKANFKMFWYVMEKSGPKT